jgi:hypothetical protein
VQRQPHRLGARVTHRPDLMVAGHTHEVVRWHENGIAIIETGVRHALRRGRPRARLRRQRARVDPRHARGLGDRVPPDTAMQRLVAARSRRGRAAARRAHRRGRGADRARRRRAPAGPAHRRRAAVEGRRADRHHEQRRRARAPRPGPITWGDLYQVHPFGNMLMVLELRGSDLREAAGARVPRQQGRRTRRSAGCSWSTTRRPAGSRVVSMRLSDGTPLQDDAVYRVVANDFLSSGVGDGYEAFGRALSRRRPA